MNRLMRYEPSSIEPVFDLLHKLFHTSRGLAVDEEESLSDIKLDITEDDAAYTLKAELPGVEKDKIDVQIEGNSVSICARTEGGKELKEGERVVCRERYVGTVNRLFSLPHEVNENNASAQFQNGLLTLILPKKSPSTQKRLQIF
ncbi:MAG: Hsp20/alpha crystallin family protein [Burkholderiaceae bacterium]|nr:Hsp20/alpha crystallin family protein [Burkholderiaceae bacterium]